MPGLHRNPPDNRDQVSDRGRTFDPPDNLYRLQPEAAERIVQNGDIALYRGNHWLSWAIQQGTGGPHSHMGMLRRLYGNGVDVLDVRESIGGRAVPLLGEAERNPGRIDIFRINRQAVPDYDFDGAVEYMRRLTSRDYGTWPLRFLMLRRLPICGAVLCRVLPITTHDDDADDGRPPFCSHAGALAAQFGGTVDLFPRKPSWLVTPTDWTHCFALDYIATVGF